MPPDISKHLKKVLDIGIAHITATDNKLLREHIGDGEDFPVTILDYRYGFLVSAWHHCNAMESEEVEEFKKNFLEVGFSKDLLALLKLACEAGCLWLQLDQDGDVVEGLPVFQW